MKYCNLQSRLVLQKELRCKTKHVFASRTLYEQLLQWLCEQSQMTSLALRLLHTRYFSLCTITMQHCRLPHFALTASVQSTAS